MAIVIISQSQKAAFYQQRWWLWTFFPVLYSTGYAGRIFFFFFFHFKKGPMVITGPLHKKLTLRDIQ